MDRREALRALGLNEDATAEDIKTAYKETAQILHPDRFTGNKKLQERACEQFKNLQEAYAYLTSGRGSRGDSDTSRASSRSARTGGSRSAAAQAEARLAGIAAARVQLVAQRDVAYDERRNGIMMVVGGGAVALLTGRRPYGLFGVIAAIASAVAVWGVVSIISAQRTISTIDDHLSELSKEQARLKSIIDEE